MLRYAQDTKNEYMPHVKLLAITALTSLDDEDTSTIYDATAEYSVLKLADIALKSGIEGIVCSTHESSVLREVYWNDFHIITPWVRFTGWDHGDQKRVMTPLRAIQLWATNIVMGRPVLEVNNRSDAIQRFFTEIESSFHILEHSILDQSEENMFVLPQRCFLTHT